MLRLATGASASPSSPSALTPCLPASLMIASPYGSFGACRRSAATEPTDFQLG